MATTARVTLTLPIELVEGIDRAHLSLRRRAHPRDHARVQSLTDERAYDFIGVQKPGRAYYKATFEL